MNEPVRPLLFTISSHSLYQGIVKNKIFKFLLYTFSIHFCKSLIQWLKLIKFQINEDKMIKSVNCSGKSKCLERKIPKYVPQALNFNFSLMIYLNFWDKKCNLGWFREFLFTISSLEWILHSLYQGCVFSKIWRELGFVHYIEYFTISRFTISRLGCISIVGNSFQFAFLDFCIIEFHQLVVRRRTGHILG